MEHWDSIINEREAAILGLLCENPCYGYTLEKIIGERGMRHWTDIGFSSIYYVLKRLEAKMLITGSCEQQEDKPSRKVYMITDAGLCMMKRKVRSLLTSHIRISSPFDLGIAHIPLITGPEAVTCMRERLAALDGTIEHVRQIQKEKEQEKCPYYVLALFDRTLAHLDTEKNWTRSFIEEVERRGSTACQ
jgi:DNA-binding PadR family transcriptional regulator